ncbi:hypothetical protein HZF05_16935 [Sphingomonas sp. CGMCC 1.13654]|uniref:Uncharacterized protein n=1 Tax=Sphingomonas chungangi TaxID=2683589 RepID=A0A838L9Q8_9SPHN|nr:hypothetical protein [Sphingomonas chungangi]MBA2935767.1 hypothetical protein [Sphingomonas chungangi]MVW54458.1 hypothetical protein [Sphingomonas chungangi]
MAELVSGYVDQELIRLYPGMAHPSIGGEQAAILTSHARCFLRRLTAL